MIDWKSEPEEFKKKFKFDNARMMGNHMIDDGNDVRLSTGADYYWHITIEDTTYSCFHDEDFDKLAKDYLDIIR